MACFLVSVAEAVVVKVAEKAAKQNELRALERNTEKAKEVTIPLSRKLKWLSNMLLGGSVLLAFEHVWHGEIVPWFPFLTAMSDPEDTDMFAGTLPFPGPYSDSKERPALFRFQGSKFGSTMKKTSDPKHHRAKQVHGSC